MNVLLVGPPGSGKGTQGAALAAELGVTHIAVGDLLREEIRAGSPLGVTVQEYVARGELVPDDVIVDLVVDRALVAVRAGGYVLDGFPRSVAQATVARELVRDEGGVPDVVIYLDVAPEVLTDRLLRRATSEGRADDTREIIEHRLALFEKATRPLRDHYDRQGLLRVVDADREPAVVLADVVATTAELSPR